MLRAFIQKRREQRQRLEKKDAQTTKKPLVLPKWQLGVKEPITRREIYENVG